MINQWKRACLLVIALYCACCLVVAQPAIAADIHSVQPDAKFTLVTDIGDGQLIFMGKGGTINKQPNPDIKVKLGDVVQITLIDGDGAEHDITIPDFNAQSDRVIGADSSSVVVFQANKAGEFQYIRPVGKQK